MPSDWSTIVCKRRCSGTIFTISGRSRRPFPIAKWWSEINSGVGKRTPWWEYEPVPQSKERKTATPTQSGAHFYPGGPDFLTCFKDGGLKVIGNEPDNNDYDPDPSEGAHISKAKAGCESSSCDASIE